jgi:hypothetical protein
LASKVLIAGDWKVTLAPLVERLIDAAALSLRP